MKTKRTQMKARQWQRVTHTEQQIEVDKSGVAVGLALAGEQIGIVFFSAHTLNKGGLALPGDLFNFFNCAHKCQ